MELKGQETRQACITHSDVLQGHLVSVVLLLSAALGGTQDIACKQELLPLLFTCWYSRQQRCQHGTWLPAARCEAHVALQGYGCSGMLSCPCPPHRLHCVPEHTCCCCASTRLHFGVIRSVSWQQLHDMHVKTRMHARRVDNMQTQACNSCMKVLASLLPAVLMEDPSGPAENAHLILHHCRQMPWLCNSCPALLDAG